MNIERPTMRQLRFVVQNMRELDRRELTATGADLDAMPGRILQSAAFVFTAVDDVGMPHAVWGLIRQRQGVGVGFAFGTKQWGRALPAVMRNIRHFVLPYLLTNNYHRVECAALAHRADVARFLSLIGAQPEAVLRSWGTGGEDFVLYRWLADEHRAATQTDEHVRH